MLDKYDQLYYKNNQNKNFRKFKKLTLEEINFIIFLLYNPKYLYCIYVYLSLLGYLIYLDYEMDKKQTNYIII